jgi:hypothetical protein
MPLNQGLTETQVAERVNRLLCPMCGTPLRVLLRREWASCECCGVDYAKAQDPGGADWVVSRYLPDGHPSCLHYLAARPRPIPQRGL